MYAVSKEQTPNQVRLERHWKDGDLVVSSVPHWIIAITNTDCNIRCPFCFAWNEITRPKDGHTDLSPQAIASLEEFVRQGTGMLTLYGGGEILLSDSFWRFLAGFDRSGLQSLGILSNLAAPIRDTALLARKLDYVKISVAGASADVYEKLMRGGRWRTLMSNIRAIKAAGLRSLWFIFILTQSNKHQIRQVMDLCDELGISHLVFKQVAPTVNQAWFERENVDREAADLAEEINRLKDRYRVKAYSDLEHGGSGLLVFADSVAEAVHRGYVCKSPWASFNAHIDGVVRPCCFNLRVSYGNINTNSVAEIWNGESVQSFRRALRDLTYLQSGCAPNCPDLAVQLQNRGCDLVVEGL